MLAEELAVDLSRRGFQARQAEPTPSSGRAEREGSQDSRAVTLVVFLPHLSRTAHDYDIALKHLGTLLEAELPTILLCDADDTIPTWAQTHDVSIVRTATSGMSDQVFEEVFRTLVGPLPPYADVVARPSVMRSPVGVGWWLHDLFVSDDHYGHVARIDGPELNVVLPGLDDPQQLRVDRSKLLVANKGADQVVLADIKHGGMLTNVRPLALGDSELSQPTSVAQGYGRTLIADTDNHRVLFTSVDVWRSEPATWAELPADPAIRFPCGVHVAAGRLWVADTYNARVLSYDLDGRTPVDVPGELLQAEPGSTPHPVAVVTDVSGSVVMVADESHKQVHFVRIDMLREGRSATPAYSALTPLAARAAPAEGPAVKLGTPGGMSVNRDNQLALVDREHACVWILDLDAVPDLTQQ